MSKKQNKKEPSPKVQSSVNPNRRLYQAIAAAVAVIGVLFLIYMRYGGSDPPLELPPEELSPYVFPTAPAPLSASELNAEVTTNLERLVAEFPQEAPPLAIAAKFFTKITKLDQAEKYWQRCLQVDPDHVGANIGLAIVMSQRDNNDEQAVKLLNKAIEADERSCQAFVQLARSQAKLGKLKASRDSAAQGLKNCPDDLDLLLAQAQAEFELEQFVAAKTLFEQSLQIAPESESALLGMANTLTRLNDTSAAELHRDKFQKVRERRKTTDGFAKVSLATYRDMAAEALSAAGQFYESQNQGVNAEKLYRRAVALSPESRVSLNRLSDFFRRTRRLNYAVLPQRKLVQLQPTNAQNQFNLGNFELAINELDRAEKAFQAAASLSNQWALPQRSLAVLYVRKGDPKTARKFAEQAVQWNPSPEHYQLLAMVCTELGDAKAALAAEQAAVDAQSR